MSIQLKSFVSLALLLLLATMMATLQPASSVLADPATQAQPLIDEQEPNDTVDQAQELSSIGAANYVNAQINTSGDVDWYKFTAEANQTYVIELFDVSKSLDSEGSNCYASGTYNGVALEVYDSPTTDTPVKYTCKPNGVGNVQSIVPFTPNGIKVYYIKIIPNANETSGSYKIRILPKYHETENNVGWDLTTYEPNNTIYQAYKISLGRTEALSSILEPRDNVNYITNNADVDWYRFNTEVDQTYMIELFEVNKSLYEPQGSNCYASGTYNGVALEVYDSLTADAPVRYTCGPNGVGNVQSIIRLRATSTTYHIKIIPNSESLSGSYKIRVLPEYDDTNSSLWDENHEPNNWASHSYRIESGQSLSSNFERPDDSQFSITAEKQPDEDWYHFSVQAGQTYDIELFNVAADLINPEGSNCYASGTYKGIALELYQPGIIDNPQDAPTPTQYSCGGTNDSVHNKIQFTAPDPIGDNDIYYIKVIPNADGVFGDYSIRVQSEGVLSVTLASLGTNTLQSVPLAPVALVTLISLVGLAIQVRRRKS